MENLTLIRPVLIKVKVTEEYTKAVAAELQEAVQHIDLELQQLDFQEKKLTPELEKKNLEGVLAARQQLKKEREQREGNRQTLLNQLKQVDKLVIGSEVPYAKMESPVEVKVGDDWLDVLGMEIVLQDGKIIAIRQGGGE